MSLQEKQSPQVIGEAPTEFPPELLARFTRAHRARAAALAIDIDHFKSLLQDRFSGRIAEREPMSRHSSAKVGGPADLFCCPKTLDDLVALVTTAELEKMPWVIHGAGSNTLVKDGGIRGLVIELGEMPAAVRVISETETATTFEVDAAFSLHALVRWTGKQGLAGMTHLAGIPASVGGALYMNAGVPQGTITDFLDAIHLLYPTGTLRWIPKAKLSLSYRKNDLPTSSIILAGRFTLARAPVEEVTQAISDTLERRKAKQPLNFPNLGSMFMNPEHDTAKPSKSNKKLPKKLPTAGELIEDAGLKGIRVGGARISPKHANFIVNEGSATAEDVLILMRLIKDKVKELTDITLKPEVRVIGEDV